MMLFWLLAPALVATSTCNNVNSDDDDHECFLQSNVLVNKENDLDLSEVEDHEDLFQTNFFVTKEKEVDQSQVEDQEQLHVKLEEAQAHIDDLKEKSVTETVASQLEKLTAKLEAAEARKEGLLRTLERASMSRQVNKARVLESKMEASWKEATDATEAALVAERHAESRRLQADKAENQNAAQRAETAALRIVESARREHVRENRENRGSIDAEHQEKASKEIAEAIPHVKPVLHSKAAVIKTRRARRRAEDHAAELSEKAVNKSAEAWQWKKLYQTAHSKAIEEKKTLDLTKAEVAAVDKEREALLAKKMKLVAELSGEPAQVQDPA